MGETLKADFTTAAIIVAIGLACALTGLGEGLGRAPNVAACMAACPGGIKEVSGRACVCR